MSEIKVTPTDASEFLIYLIELGGAYYVDPKDHIIKTTEKNKVITIPITDDVKGPQHPLMVFHDRMPMGDFVVLNPYEETIIESKEKDWFFHTRELILKKFVCVVYETIISASTASDEELKDLGYGGLDIIAKFKDDIDHKTAAEFGKLLEDNVIRIEYDATERTAKLVTDLFDDEFVEGKKGIRKKSWKVFKGIMETIFKTDDFTEHYAFKATSVSTPKCETILNVLAKVYDQLDEYLEKLLDIDVDIHTFMKHLPNIELYRSITNFVGGSKTSKTGRAKNQNVPVWVDNPTWDNPAVQHTSGNVPIFAVGANNGYQDPNNNPYMRMPQANPYMQGPRHNPYMANNHMNRPTVNLGYNMNTNNNIIGPNYHR